MFFPYRAKNPPEHFPYITIALIVINVLIFALTSDNFLIARESVVQEYAVSHETLSLWRLLTAMFLHGSLLHLAGNMLFLWLFGASVEGRLRPLPYLAVYLLSGYGGGLLHDAVFGLANPTQYSLGASGAIMGLCGAYLYMFPYSLICVFWWFYFMRGVVEWQARWLVLVYVGFDFLNALLLRGEDGVGHFAHIGGFGMGLLAVFLLRARRDSEDVSAVQAIRAEVKDYSLLSASELETLLLHPTEDMELVLAYCEKAVTGYQGARMDGVLPIINQYAKQLMAQVDPNRLAQVLLHLPVGMGGMPPVFYLRLASRLESIASNDLASQIYRRVYELNPNSPDTEVALFRLGQLMQHTLQNRAYAHATYNELLRLFPDGRMALEARRALQQM